MEVTLSRALAVSIAVHIAVIGAPLLGQATHTADMAHMRADAGRSRITVSIGLGAQRTVSDVAIATPQPTSLQAAEDTSTPDTTLATQGKELLPLTGDDYYPTHELTRRPQPVALVDLDTPEVRPWVASGKLELTLWIDPRGAVANVTVESTNLPDAFSRAAVQAFKQSRFQPGERDGLPVGSIMRIEVRYDDGRLPAGGREPISSPSPSAAGTPSSPGSP